MKPSSSDEHNGRTMPHYLGNNITARGEMKEPLGALILHGFTSSLDTVRVLELMVEGLGLPYRMPVLRGHNSHYKNLQGVGWPQWYADAEAALKELLNEVDRAVILGLSVGGLITLDLATRYTARLAGIATIAAALRYLSPLTKLTPLLAAILPEFNSPNSFNDQELAKRNTNYKKFPTKSFKSAWEYAKLIEGKLPQVRTPILVIASRKDTIVAPSAAATIYERVSTPNAQKQIVWFERSGHEMLQDLEADAVVKTIEDWLIDDIGAVRPLKEQL
jgi:carboxylesterase